LDVLIDMGGGFTSAAGGECLVRRHVEDVARGAGGGQPVGVELRRLNVACGLDNRREKLDWAEAAVTVAVAIAVPSSFCAWNTNPNSPASLGVNESVLPAKE